MYSMFYLYCMCIAYIIETNRELLYIIIVSTEKVFATIATAVNSWHSISQYRNKRRVHAIWLSTYT